MQCKADERKEKRKLLFSLCTIIFKSTLNLRNNSVVARYNPITSSYRNDVTKIRPFTCFCAVVARLNCLTMLTTDKLKLI